MLISVIMPVYNAAEYVAEACASVLVQTYADLELIVVDAGSTDGSLEIVRDFAARDSRVRVICGGRMGPGEARNLGMESMKGDWFTFLDSDDFLHPLCLATMRAHAVPSVDVVEVDYDRTREYEVVSSVRSRMATDKSWRGMVWGRLYRSERFGSVRFEHWFNHEDVAWCTAVFASCRKLIVTGGGRLYYYRPAHGIHERGDELSLLIPLWKYQSRVVPEMRSLLGEMAYAAVKRNLNRDKAKRVLKLSEEGVLSLDNLSFRKRLRLHVRGRM